MIVTLGQQYNVGEKPTVILYTYITIIAYLVFGMYVWCPCMVINNVNVQNNGGFPPDILL